MGQQPFGDTTLTKVFVGGLAWETQKDVLRDHFARFGDILEAVIISDKTSGRSKGYGFVTFKDAESAKKACEDPSPVINGRRANCNLASLGARRLRPSPPPTPISTTPPPPPPRHGARGVAAPPWYYATGTPGPYPQHHHHYHAGVVPFYAAGAATTPAAYGYSPSYVTDYGYNQKLSHGGGGSYVQGQFSHVPIPKPRRDFCSKCYAACIPTVSLPAPPAPHHGSSCSHLPSNYCKHHDHYPHHHLQASCNPCYHSGTC
ncbi:probable RNA-binding protein ARP1 isoform X2 [Dioscorea cayenensis subsp. rotundata]|uniref:Probable RNA-binding protein ARP1 isoform X2 n=1 Tax=Dioscorea cayennensis subsp. rotundata TaxID=55577 RepID=A0AB40BSH3_DIOCR|nr:probable RNA-binding protein ARP1 isoform X2 [Dioscorea cayenensis subsp. rotundata]